jgi:hypothetical protein
MKRRQFEKLGYHLVSVPHWKISLRLPDDEKMKSLEKLVLASAKAN